MSTKVTLPQRQRSFGTSGDNLYNLDTMPSHHLPPLTSQTVGGGGHHHGATNAGVKVQQLFEDPKHDHDKKRENIQNGGVQDTSLPAVRPTSTGSGGSKAGSAKQREVPMTAEVAMKKYMHKLSSFEHHEIFNFPQIYFVGPNSKKRQGV